MASRAMLSETDHHHQQKHQIHSQIGLNALLLEKHSALEEQV